MLQPEKQNLHFTSLELKEKLSATLEVDETYSQIGTTNNRPHMADWI